METQYPKINADAILAAVRKTFPTAECHQFKSIFYIEPNVYDLNVHDIVGISIVLTREWDSATVTSSLTSNSKPELIFAVSDLLSEFIVDGEFVTFDVPESKYTLKSDE